MSLCRFMSQYLMLHCITGQIRWNVVRLHYVMHPVRLLSDLWSVSETKFVSSEDFLCPSRSVMCHSHIIWHSFKAQHCWSELWAVPWGFLQTLRHPPRVSSGMHTWAEHASLIDCCYCKSSPHTSDNLPHSRHTFLCCKGLDFSSIL